MKSHTKKIISINIDKELKKSYLGYAMSVIIGRALPDVRDGLKPVHRRILFAMHELGNFWNKSYKKSARIVGDVIGKYHPHGDTAVYDTIVRMAQPFSMRYTLIDGQGNFGSIDGDSAAAMRYTEIRMKKIAHELLADLEKNTVDFVSNYDGTEKIVNIMPTRIPNLLINGASGIAVGMATNIPPHNLSEVIDACLVLIENPHVKIEELMKYIPGPDFPTSAIINGQSGIKQAYENGRGKIYIRARAYIEIDQKTKKETIVVNEIPYQVNKSKLIEKIFELMKEKKIEGISNIRDESDKDGMRITIEVKRDFSGEIVLNNLYLLTQLQISFHINMVALYQGKPKILSLKKILNSFIDHRKEIIIRRTIFDLEKTKEKIHTIEGLIIAICNISSIIEIIKSSSSLEESKNKLISHSWKIEKIDDSIIKLIEKENINTEFSKQIKNHTNYVLTEKQIKSILNLRLQRLTSLENKKLLEEYKILSKNVFYLRKILHSSNYLLKIIKRELVDIKKQYGDARKTEIQINESNVNVEDLINPEDVVVTLSYQGYIKYQPLIDYETQKRGGKGKSAASIKEEDFIYKILVANTHDNILFFSNYGKIFSVKIYQLPESSREARGRPIVNLLKLGKSERITAIFSIKNYHKKSLYIFMATTSGIVKKTSLNEFKRLCHTGIIAISLNKNDELVGVDLTNGNNDIMLFSSYGKVVKFHENEVRDMKRTAIGVRGMNLVEGDKIVSLIVPKSNEPILTVTKHGYGKRTKYTEYPTKSRATQGVISIRASKRNGKVVGAVQIKEKDQIMIITDIGTLVRIRASDINIVKRNTQGVILIRTSKNENVVGLQRIDDL